MLFIGLGGASCSVVYAPQLAYRRATVTGAGAFNTDKLKLGK